MPANEADRFPLGKDIAPELVDMARKGYELETVGRVEEAARLYQDGLKAARSSGDHRAEVTFLNYLGLLYLEQRRDLAGAIRHLESGLEIANSHKAPIAVAMCYVNLAEPYLAAGRKSEAFRGLTYAVKTLHEIGDSEHEAKALGMLGVFHQREGNVRAAADCYRSILGLFETRGDVSGQFETLYNLALLLQKDDHIKQAIGYYEAALYLMAGLSEAQRSALHPELRHGRAEASVLGNLGIAYRTEKRFQEALNVAERTLNLERDLSKGGDQTGVARALANLGLAQREVKQTEAAKMSFRDALTLLEPGDPMRPQIFGWLNETR